MVTTVGSDMGVMVEVVVIGCPCYDGESKNGGKKRNDSAVEVRMISWVG